MGTPAKAFDVFISHSSLDQHPASLIKQHLQSQGLRCWKAPDDILPGESWPQAILRAIGNSELMLLVWTGSATTSQEVSKELTLAMRSDVTVVPFRIEDVGAPGEWEYHLANTHWMDACDGRIEDHLEGLAIYLRRILEARGATDFSASADEEQRPQDVLPEEVVATDLPTAPGDPSAGERGPAEIWQARRNSGFGVASFSAGIAAGVAFLVCMGVALAMEASNPGVFDGDSLAATALGLFVLACLGASLLALGLGIAGLFDEKRKKTLAALGLAFGAATAIAIVLLMIAGTVQP